MESSLKGKNAIVTGGSRGIGAGIATELASRGASVLIIYKSATAEAEKVVSNINAAGGNAVALKADCMSPESPAAIVKENLKQFDGGVDIIVNNAGVGDDLYVKVADRPAVPMQDLTIEMYDKLFITNVRFPLFLVKEAIPYLRPGGRIVNVSSVLARIVWPDTHLYSATKAAFESLTRSLAVQLGQKYEVTVNAVNPGPVRTELWDTTEGDNTFAPFVKGTPAGPRIANVDDISPIVAFLCEEQSRWVTGNVTCANGGFLMT